MDGPGIQLFWQRQVKRSSKDKNLVKTLSKRVKELNKEVKLLNRQIAEMHKEHDKPVKVSLPPLVGHETITNVGIGKSQ